MKKPRLPYYKAYPRDFIEGTVGMSFELKGAYRLLLDLIYMQGGELPDDARYISGLLGCTVRKWGTLRKELILLGKINVENGSITNYRAIIELEITRKFIDKQSQNRSNPNKNKGLQSPAFNHTDTDTDIAATQPHARGKKQAENLDGLQQKLIDAAGEKIHPHGVFDLSAIIGLITAGVDLETDILPTIKARCATMQRPARGWAYFTEAIKDAHNRRIEAGKGLSKPKETIKPDSELSGEDLNAEWTKRLNYARRNRTWFTAVWGAMPNKEGCRVPEHLLQPNDGKHPHGGNWIEQ